MKKLSFILGLGLMANVSSAKIYPVWTTANLAGTACTIFAVGFWEDNETSDPADDVLLGTDIQIICPSGRLKVWDITDDAIGSPPDHEVPVEDLEKQIRNYNEIMKRQEQQKQPVRKEE